MFKKNKIIGFIFYLKLLFSISIIYCDKAETKISRNILHWPCPAKLEKIKKCDECTLNQWAKIIFKLKQRPIEFSSLPDQNQYKENILNLKRFKETLYEVTQIIKSNLSSNNLWMEKISLVEKNPELFLLDRPTTKDEEKNFIFKPYVQKLIISPPKKVIFFGDLHGSVHTLIRSLLKLKKEGYINNNFKLIDPNSYLIFLGDYTDRGIYGLETLFTILLLKKNNPEEVFLLRGNHEDYLVGLKFYKKSFELEPKDRAPGFIEELRYKLNMSMKDEIEIYRFYDTLPVALYLGSGENPINFVQCCHGGLELGYNPHKFLSSDNSIHFEEIKELYRKNYFYSKLNQHFRNMIKRNFDFENLCEEIQNFIPKAPFDSSDPSNPKHFIGFLWNDFFVDKTKEIGPRGKHFTGLKHSNPKDSFSGWVFGSKLTYQILNWGNSQKSKLRGLIRAHQHNNDTGGPMLTELCCTKGAVNIWQSNQVYCFISSPQSKLEETGEECFTYDSFAILTVDKNFNEWQIDHYWKDNALKKKIWNKKNIKQPKYE